MKTAFVVGMLIIGFYSTSALASQYWIVLDSNTNRCSVVAEKPNDPSVRFVGAVAFPTWREAEYTMRTTSVCISD